MKSETNKIVVVGHKNPDTDSICSAIAYAHLKQQRDREFIYEARRAGRVNEETQYVLERFGVNEPEYIADVGTQVRDISIREVAGIPRSKSLKMAWGLMKEAGAVTLPITDGPHLEGLITIKDIVTAYMDVFDSEILAMSKTSYANVIDTLEAELLVGDAQAVIERGKIIIAAGSAEMMEEYIDEGDIVIVSNRYESQFCAIEMGAGCIVVCNNTPVSKTMQKLAADKGCTILVTPYDTYSVARLINQSAPVSYFMRAEGLITFKADDYTEDIKKVMAEKRHRDFPVLDRQGHYCGMISRRFLLNMQRKRIILVDHNEKSQAVDGLEEAEIMEIIDHHRLGSIETLAPVYFRNQPVGCTATIIYQMYREMGVEITPQIAGLLCAAILSDTLMYRSPTCTPTDQAACEELAVIAGIDAEQFAREMFQAGSRVGEKSAEEIFYQDFKKFTINGVSFGIGQINSLSEEELQAMKEKLKPYMEGVSKEQGLNMVLFMLTNILEEDTELIYEGKEAVEILSKAFEQEPEQEAFRLKGVVSRKKQLIPAIMAGMQE